MNFKVEDPSIRISARTERPCIVVACEVFVADYALKKVTPCPALRQGISATPGMVISNELACAGERSFAIGIWLNRFAVTILCRAQLAFAFCEGSSRHSPTMHPMLMGP